MASLEFHAEDVSATRSGDYYQLSLGPIGSDWKEGDSLEVEGPYLLIQREFEFDSSECSIESDDERYRGRFPLKLIELTHTRLEFEIPRSRNNRVSISFSLQPIEFDEVRRIGEVIFGLREPESGDDGPEFAGSP